MRNGLTLFDEALAPGSGTDADYRQADLLRAEETHSWFRQRAKLLIWALGRYFPRAQSLLDLGCGRGALLSAVSGDCPALRLSGSDVLESSLLAARARLPDVPLYQFDAQRLPFDREFDVITCCDVLEHIDDDAAVARECFRATTPGGGLIVTVPQHPWLWSRVDEVSGHRRRYKRKRLRCTIDRAGFAVEMVTSFVTITLPALAIHRAKQDRADRALKPAAELKIGKITNAILKWTLTLERQGIKLGASLPIGSSLLLIARRH